MLPIDMMMPPRHADLVRLDHDVSVPASLGRFEPVACEFETKTQRIAEIDRVHETAIDGAGMLDPARVETLRDLPERRLTDIERQMME